MAATSKSPAAEARVPDRFSSASKVIGIVARDPVVFRSVVDAFEAGDNKLFQHLLADLKVGDDCDVICSWLRSKECVLECWEVCGPPPRQPVTVDQVVKFADVVANLSQDEFLTRRLVDAVQDRDSVAFKTVVADLGAEQICHLLCHWVSVVRYRLICEVVCGEQGVQTDQVVAELAREGAAVGQLAKRSVALRSAIAAAVASDVDTLSDIVGGFVDCQWICEWFCSWRCVWICLPFCQSFPIPEIKDPVEEMREFALFSAQLAENKDAFPRLLAALQTGDSKSFAALVTEYKAERYCLQLCHWFCYEICSRWCFVICRPVPSALVPWFTQVGFLNIFTNVNSQPNSGTPATGLTTCTSFPGLSYGGGPNFAFTGQLQLGGLCPAYSPISPGTLMQYRFLYAASTSTSLTTATTLTAPISSSVPSITVASVSGLPVAGLPGTPFNVTIVSTGEIMTVTNYAGTTLDVLRGQNGTVGRAAGAGATLSTLAPITTSLLWQVEDTREIPWPTHDSSWITTAGSASTPQTVAIGPTAIADVPPPTVGSPWYWPQTHYIVPDSDGWVTFDSSFLSGSSLTNLLGFDSSQVIVGGTPPLPGAGNPVAVAQQKNGTDVLIAFEATRVTTFPPADTYQAPTQLHVNNWNEVNQLNLVEFTSGCCTPIDDSVGVQFTVDHELMAAGNWILGITSCAPTPGTIAGTGVAPWATPRGGSGTITEDTTTWSPCSYTVGLSTRPGLTNGLEDRDYEYVSQSFCIEHPNTGTTTAGTTSVLLQDTSASWITNQYVGYYLLYTSGPAAGQAQVITANTPTTISTAAFSAAPDSSGDTFVIVAS
jgi:hypothetical protein